MLILCHHADAELIFFGVAATMARCASWNVQSGIHDESLARTLAKLTKGVKGIKSGNHLPPTRRMIPSFTFDVGLSMSSVEVN